MKEKLIIAIVVTYNGEKWIRECLTSLKNSTVRVNIVVVDNSSSDNTVKIIRNNYKSVRLIELKENLGFGKANNIGLKIALGKKADYVFLLNQDAWVLPETIERLERAFCDRPEFGILSPIHLNGTGDNFDFGFYNYLINTLGSRNLFFNLLYHKTCTLEILNVNFVNAAGWLISRDCLNKVGAFLPIFKHYGEDVSYCQRVKFVGLKIGVVFSAVIHHDREDRAVNLGTSSVSTENRKTNLLIEFCDINNENSSSALKKTKYKLVLAIIKSIIGGKNDLKHSLELLRFLIEKNKDIKKFRKVVFYPPE